MSQEAFAYGAYGVLLDNRPEEDLRELARLVRDKVLAARARAEADYGEPDVVTTRVFGHYRKKAAAALSAAGVLCPRGARLIWTGDEDYRPGRCNIPPGQLVFGFGLFRKPWTWPDIHPSFRKAARLYSWAEVV